MVGSRTLTALAGLGASLVVSVLLWEAFGTVAILLFVPFVPFLFRGVGNRDAADARTVRECPACGFRTRSPEYEYCPRDGRRLE